MKTSNYISTLVKRANKQDLLAMKTLYEMFSKEMLTASFRITNNLADSEDILQEAFLTSFQKLEKLKDASKYGGWLKRIVINNSLSLVKKRVKFSDIEMLPEVAEEADEPSWFEHIPFEKIKKAINELPDGCREVFSLYLLENYKHREISALLNITLSTSKSQYRYALKLLKQKLNKTIKHH